MLTIERVTPESLHTFKAVRLQALQESPQAFGSTYASEVQLHDEDWRERAARCTKEGHIGYLALEHNIPVGIVRGTPDDQDPFAAWVESMWVAPSHRRRKIGRLLVRQIIAWAQDRGLKSLLLHVTGNNSPAIRFYESLGFTRTGRVVPYPHDAALSEIEMGLVFP